MSVPARSSRRLAIAFAAFALLWTIALLVPIPKRDAEQVLGSTSRMFLFGKALHVGAYAFLTILAGFLALQRRHRWVLLAGLVVHGGLTEFTQQFVGRGGAWSDWGLDCIGIGIGFLVGIRGWKRLFRPEALESPPSATAGTSA